MIINRILLLSFAFSCLASTNILSDDNHLETWQLSYLNKMTPEELQFTTNYLHLLYANAVIELKVRQLLTAIYRLNQSVRTNIAVHKNATEELATLKTLIDRLSYVTNARTIYIQTLHACTTHYNQNGKAIINAALEQLQLYAQTALCTWADENANKTAEQLKKSSSVFTESLGHFQGVSLLHKEMSEGRIPVEISKEQKQYKSLLILDVILRNNPELYAVTENLMDALNETSDHAALVIAAGTEIYKQYYTVLYKMVTAPSSDKCYATTLFSMHGLLPEEYKSMLPDADHVFEHVLQTTKLYTQTEFSQL